MRATTSEQNPFRSVHRSIADGSKDPSLHLRGGKGVRFIK